MTPHERFVSDDAGMLRFTTTDAAEMRFWDALGKQGLRVRICQRRWSVDDIRWKVDDALNFVASVRLVCVPEQGPR